MTPSSDNPYVDVDDPAGCLVIDIATQLDAPLDPTGKNLQLAKRMVEQFLEAHMCDDELDSDKICEDEELEMACEDKPKIILKPCPFCESTDVQMDEWAPYNDTVKCNACWAFGPIFKHEPEKAAEAWNNAPRKARERDLDVALTEVMGWISGWSPNFEEDEEWPATKEKAEKALEG